MTIDEGLLKRIDRLAEQQNTNRSSLIERMLREAATEDEMLNNPLIRGMVASAMSQPSVVASLSKALKANLDDEQWAAVKQRLDQFGRATEDEEPG